VLAGLTRLADGPPLWGTRLEWCELVEAVRSFEIRWGGHSKAGGAPSPGPPGGRLLGFGAWTLRRPRVRLSRMGAAFLVSLRGHRVIDVDANAVTMVTRTSARLRAYRAEIDADAVLAWSIGVAG
jgi:hypothetical protein